MSNTVKSLFGTDGIRGQVGEWPITPEGMLKLGWAAGKVLGGESGRILIGKDTRLSGYLFESVLEAGLIASGMDVRLLGPIPTPAIAYLTRSFRAKAGIVISASHNPHQDNGVKFFSSEGSKLSDAQEKAIEALMNQPLALVSSSQLGRVKRIDDALGRYSEFCKSRLPLGMSFKGLKLVVDCANGATYSVAPSVLRELDAEIVVIAAEPDGLNINRDCGSTHLKNLQARVVAEKAHLGIAFDGDGDRVLMVDADGSVIDGDQLLYLLVRYHWNQSAYRQGVVGTLMTNLGLEQALERMNIPFYRAKVGDRYVMEALLERGWVLGGEASGHVLCLDLASTGDGLLVALQILSLIVQTQSDIKSLVRDMVVYPQILLNVRVPSSVKLNLSDPAIRSVVHDIERELGHRGRVLLRASGTEPLVRVMVEGETLELIQPLARRLVACLESWV
jgi:phosphoglucosamine mutase